MSFACPSRCGWSLVRRARADRAAWTAGQRILHWVSALLVLATFALGLTMVALPLTRLYEKFMAYQIHKSLGLVVLALTVLRAVLRIVHGRPAWEMALPPWQRRAAEAGHGLIYLLLIAVPVLGYLSACAAPVQVPTTLFLQIAVPHVIGPDEALYNRLRNLHELLAWTLLVVAIGHAAMAVKHHRHGLPTLRHMLRGG